MPGEVDLAALYADLETYARKEHDLTRDTAARYAMLGVWAYQLRGAVPPIASGRRSRRHNRALQRAWDRGEREGLAVRPADDSAHLRGEAFDLVRSRGVDIFARYAHYQGMRWGGTFRRRDPLHFDQGSE